MRHTRPAPARRPRWRGAAGPPLNRVSSERTVVTEEGRALLGEAKTLLKAFVRDRERGHGIER